MFALRKTAYLLKGRMKSRVLLMGLSRTSLILALAPVAALAVLVLTTSPTFAANGLIGAWELDEGTGTSVADTSGNGNNGTIVRGTGTGSPAWVAPGHDASTPNALDFDGSGTPGTASNTVNLGTSPNLDQLNNYTISLWVKFKSGYVGSGGTWANLVGRNSSGANWAWMIYVNSSGQIRPHHRNSNGSFAPLTNSATIMPVGQWVHIEQVADGTRLHLYINGQEDPNFPITYSGTTMSLPTANTYIGQDAREYAPKATISDVKIYNDAALAPQVATSPASSISQTTATLRGSLNSLGDYTTAKVFFRYRLAGSSGAYTETAPQTVSATGPFSANISGLTSATQYEFLPVVQWQGRDGLQEATGTKLTFTTLAYAVNVQVVDNLTSEDGDTGSFKVCLNAQPSAAVTIPLSSSNTNEGTVPASITIQPADWNNCNANVVTVTGVDDTPPVGDGSVLYTIITGDVTSADPNFNALVGSDVADVSMENQNNDPPGVVATVVSNDNKTSEGGDTARVRFSLLSAPSADVTIPLSLSDASEATLNGVTSITITPANWDQPQNNEVLITGVDDSLTDGDISYSLITGDITSADGGYDALTSSDLADPQLINVDNDSPNVTVTQTGGATSAVEGGATDTFTVVLDTQPQSGNSVVISLQPDAQVDLGNGAGIAKQLTFNNSNWNTPQTVTVTANDDSAIEGDHSGHIAISIDPSTTEDSYAPIDPNDVTVQITDNDDDNDTIPATEENAGPNSGDANNDGTPDSLQPNVATFVNDVTGEYAVVEVSDDCQLNAVGMADEASQTAQDANYQYPYGFMNFEADCGTPGYTADVNMYFFGATGSPKLRKYNPNNRTYFAVDSANVQEVTIAGAKAVKSSFQIKDGDTLDMDGTADGTIVDPAGLAVQVQNGSLGNLANTGLTALVYSSIAAILIACGLMVRRRRTTS